MVNSNNFTTALVISTTLSRITYTKTGFLYLLFLHISPYHNHHHGTTIQEFAYTSGQAKKNNVWCRITYGADKFLTFHCICLPVCFSSYDNCDNTPELRWFLIHYNVCPNVFLSDFDLSLLACFRRLSWCLCVYLFLLVIDDVRCFYLFRFSFL